MSHSDFKTHHALRVDVIKLSSALISKSDSYDIILQNQEISTFAIHMSALPTTLALLHIGAALRLLIFASSAGAINTDCNRPERRNGGFAESTSSCSSRWACCYDVLVGFCVCAAV
ncbi:unnamed protein product [Polarella glacialis]|uniref:Uncharacterized protein n=1 Tax=Polarella glacialis TaxID=89957 RepID=A0A813FJV4_POLGL|nr:unnamed protein product [Polarella glacialis]